MKSTELALKAYKQARKRVDVGYNNYIAACESNEKQTVLLYSDVEPFASINETFFWAMSLYDMTSKKQAIEEDIKKFMSGLKFVVNTMKHSESAFDTYAFSHPGVKMSAKVTDTPNGPVFEEVNLEPSILFAGFDGKNIPNKNKGQLGNYNKLIKEKSIPQIMATLDLYIQEMIDI